MIKNIEFVKEHYIDQIDALNGFIKDAYPYLPNQDNSLIRFGGGTALAIYYFQHRLSFDIDLFVTDVQILNYLSPKHWIEETNSFNGDNYRAPLKTLTSSEPKRGVRLCRTFFES